MAVVGLALLLLCLWQIAAAGQGLEIITVRSTMPPLTLIAPAGVPPGSRPLVLIGHGFAGSSLIMRGFAYTLAHAGYATLAWDFDGHGANPRSLRAGPLLDNAEAALAEARSRGWAPPGRVAILGHSMGSGVALQFGLAHPDTAATIAISPVGVTVTRELPRNLLLMAGSLETPFLRTAERQLTEAGGPGGDPRQGSGRQLVVIPNVEHMSILFAPAAHAAVVTWLDAVFGPQPGARAYTDQRMLWYGLGLLGLLLLAAAIAPLFHEPAPLTGSPRPLWRRLLALVGGALAATLILRGVSAAGVGLFQLFGILIGGYLMLWFAVAGVAGLLILGERPALPSRLALLGGLVAFAALWLGVGLLGEWVWFPWLLIGERLRFWPIGVVLVLPWSLLVAQITNSEGWGGQAGRWLLGSIAQVGGLLLAMRLSPELGFLSLILPVFPVVLLLHVLAAGPQRGRWPFALSGALFITWMLLAVFPLQ